MALREIEGPSLYYLPPLCPIYLDGTEVPEHLLSHVTEVVTKRKLDDQREQVTFQYFVEK